jgi:hypothetical protein
LLRCLRYIELNPVRAGMIALPEHYRWSSVHAHLGKRPDPRWTPHPLYLALGEDPAIRSHLLSCPADGTYLFRGYPVHSRPSPARASLRLSRVSDHGRENAQSPILLAITRPAC